MSVATTTARPELRAYQRAAVAWIVSRRGSILDMYMGTGKTACAIAAAEALCVSRMLVLCPKSVTPVWPFAIRKHACTPTRALVLGQRLLEVRHEHEGQTYTRDMGNSGSSEDKLGAMQRFRASTFSGLQVLVLNYEALLNDQIGAWLAQAWAPQLLVCDESHRLKDSQTKTSKRVQRISSGARHVVCMTGTPQPHSWLDWFGQVRVANAQVFGPSIFIHKRQFAAMGGYGGKEVVGIMPRMKPLWLAELAKVVYHVGRNAVDLPPAQTVVVRVELGEAARKLSADLLSGLRAECKSGTITTTSAMTALLRASQISGGHATFDDGAGAKLIDDAKLVALRSIVEGAVDEPLVVFCRFVPEIHAICKMLADMGVSTSVRRGGVNQLDEWQAGKTRVMVAQIQSGGVGVDMTRAAIDVFYSLSYSPADVEQARSRIHRHGQARPVWHYELVSDNQIDDMVRAIVRNKTTDAQGTTDALQGIARELIAQLRLSSGEEVAPE